MSTIEKTAEKAAAALAEAVRLLAEQYPMDGGPVTLTVRTGTGPASEVEVPAELAEAIGQLVAREGAKWRQAHSDEAGVCAHCHGAGRADETRTCPTCSDRMRWRTARPDEPVESGWWECECGAVVLGDYEPRNVRPIADLVVDQATEDTEVEDIEVYVGDVHDAISDGPTVTDDEARAALRAALARRGLATVPVLDEPAPDWHCTLHGEWGNGERACPYCLRDED